MSAFAETLTDRERRRGRIYAYFACYFGCFSEVMLDSSAIVILYIGMLGGTSMTAMLITSFTGLFGMLTMIPCAALIGRIGMRKAVVIACLIACFGFVLMGAAPFFGAARLPVAMIGCLAYCFQRSLYGVAWFPLLDAFLRPQDRGSFFGTMRYSYMIISGVIFFIFGKLMGKEPPLWMMQAIIAAAGVLVLGRLYCILHFPADVHEERPAVKNNFREAFMTALRNGPLTGYAVYVCLFGIAYSSILPLTLLYLRNGIKLPSGTVQIFSTAGIAGSVISYAVYGFMLRKLKIKRMELLVHFTFIAVALTFFALPGSCRGFIWIAGAVYFLGAFAEASFRCNNSAEILALARPGNKPMASAFVQTYQYTGNCVTRACSAFVMGSGLLADSWQLGSRTITSFQTMFLVCGVLAVLMLILIPTLPSVVPHHQDYYEPMN